MKTILIIDGQGGGMGKSLIAGIRREGLPVRLVAAGTNAMATAAMMKAGADVGVTGENAILFNCPRADLIVGPIGIVLANAMYGELTPAVARAVAESDAPKVLIPSARCHVQVAGLPEKPVGSYMEDGLALIRAQLSQGEESPR